MVQINFAQKSVNVKIVYYGPGMSGKTTNLEIVHQRAPEANRGDLTSISTDGDRTLFFDFMPLDLGTVAGMRTQFQIYTVPGQVYYNSTRKLVLQGVDGVIFVADSSSAMTQENLESLRNLEENLAEYGKSLDTVPYVIQYNKRDLPDALPVEQLEQTLNPRGVPFFEAVANTGQGVFPTLKALAARVLDTIHAQHGGATAAQPARAQAAAAAAAPAAAAPQHAQPAPPAQYAQPMQPSGPHHAAPAVAAQHGYHPAPAGHGHGAPPMHGYEPVPPAGVPQAAPHHLHAPAAGPGPIPYDDGSHAHPAHAQHPQHPQHPTHAGHAPAIPVAPPMHAGQGVQGLGMPAGYAAPAQKPFAQPPGPAPSLRLAGQPDPRSSSVAHAADAHHPPGGMMRVGASSMAPPPSAQGRGNASAQAATRLKPRSARPTPRPASAKRSGVLTVVFVALALVAGVVLGSVVFNVL